MRISDWSSDVCSSDLRPLGEVPRAHVHRRVRGSHPGGEADELPRARPDLQAGHHQLPRPAAAHGGIRRLPSQRAFGRSEEHTSELQSLMRISYAVFCLKKKKSKTNINNTTSVYYLHTNLLIIIKLY